MVGHSVEGKFDAAATSGDLIGSQQQGNLSWKQSEALHLNAQRLHNLKLPK
jgi:hypothetical protein